MAKPCVVAFCENIGTLTFPPDETKRAQWIEAIKHNKKIGLTLGKYSRICPAHFKPDDFTQTQDTNAKRKKLMKTVVPSIFTSHREAAQESTSVSLRAPIVELPSSQAKIKQQQGSSLTPQASITEQSSLSKSQAGRERGSLSPSEAPIVGQFDPKKAQKGYSRTPQVTFVLVQPFMETTSSDTGEDPLKFSDEETEYGSNFDVLTSSHDNTHFHKPPSPVEFVEKHENDVQTEEPIHNCKTCSLCNFKNSDKSECGSNFQDLSSSHGNINFQKPPSPVVLLEKHEKYVQTEEPIHNCQTFSINNFKNCDKSVHFYTGLEDFSKFMLVFYTLGKSVYHLNYFYGRPPEKIDVLDFFFMTLVILRRHTPMEEIAMRYMITIKQVYNIFTTWVKFMSLQWRQLDVWIDREKVQAYMPSDFYDKFPATRVILDATECPIKKPGLPTAQQVTFSSYKNRNTIKAIIGITPSGLISYVSPCYGGSATDRQIIERSNIIHRFDYNDEIMVDKGLNVQDILVAHGVKVNMPAFFKKGNQLGSNTLTTNRKVASKRVHIERVIGMLKTYKILTQPMNLTETILSSDIMLICAMLVNFRANIIDKNA